MKKNFISNLIIIILLGVVVILAIKLSSSPSDNNEMKADATTGATQKSANAVINNIMTRASVRSYTDQKVNKSAIDTLLKAAMAAPTAVNKQPWRYVVVEKPEILQQLSQATKGAYMAEKAPLAIVVCGDMSVALEGEAQAYWIQDCSAATENLLLAAHAIGLGAVWCGVAPIEANIAKVTEILKLPKGIIPLNIVVIGHPDGPTEPKDKWHPDYVHYESW